MKYMRVEDLEEGDIIKFNVKFLKASGFVKHIIDLGEKHNAKIHPMGGDWFDFEFVDEFGKGIREGITLGGLKFCRKFHEYEHPPFEIIELGK